MSSEASLIVATFQFLAVQGVTSAIRAADLESGDVETPAGFIEQPQRRFLDSDSFEPSIGDRSSAGYDRGDAAPPNQTLEIDRYHPRLVDRIEPAPIVECPTPPIPNGQPGADCQLPIQPPWAVVPWSDAEARYLARNEQLQRRVRLSDSAHTGVVAPGQMLDVVA